jgi:hypothetical protein
MTSSSCLRAIPGERDYRTRLPPRVLTPKRSSAHSCRIFGAGTLVHKCVLLGMDPPVRTSRTSSPSSRVAASFDGSPSSLPIAGWPSISPSPPRRVDSSGPLFWTVLPARAIDVDCATSRDRERPVQQGGLTSRRCKGRIHPGFVLDSIGETEYSLFVGLDALPALRLDLQWAHSRTTFVRDRSSGWRACVCTSTAPIAKCFALHARTMTRARPISCGRSSFTTRSSTNLRLD